MKENKAKHEFNIWETKCKQQKDRMKSQFIHKCSFNTKVKCFLYFKGLIFKKVKINTHTKLTRLAFSKQKPKLPDRTSITQKCLETLYIYIYRYIYIYTYVLLLNIKAISKNLRKLMSLIFFFSSIGKASPSSDITTDGQYQIASQDRWKQEESNGGT